MSCVLARRLKEKTMGVVITVAIEKGGVGKTATVTNLAAIYAEQGKKVLVIDMDAQCNSTYFMTGNKKRQNIYRGKGVAEMLRVYGQQVDLSRYIQPTQIENCWIIPSNAATNSIPEILNLLHRDYEINPNAFLAYSIAPLQEEFDYIFIDTPPSLDLLTTNALVACDYVLIPFNAEEQALDGLQDTNEIRMRLEKEVDATIKLLGIVFTMVEARSSLTKVMRDALLQDERYADSVLKTEVRKGQSVKESSTYGMPVVLSAKTSNPAKDYVKLAAELEKRIKTLQAEG